METKVKKGRNHKQQREERMQQRQQNREAMSLARRIRLDKEREMTERRLGYRSGREKVSDFLGYFQRYCEGYGLKDYKVMRLSLRRFRDFLADSPKYSGLVSHLRPELVTKDMMGDFTRYLQGRSKGYGAWSIYQRFKKVVNRKTNNVLNIFKVFPLFPIGQQSILCHVLALLLIAQIFHRKHTKYRIIIFKQLPESCLISLSDGFYNAFHVHTSLF